MDFFGKALKVGRFYFAFTEDTRDLMEQQEISKIGKNRTANYVQMDKTGTSCKQYTNKGVFDVEYKDILSNINLRLSKFSKRKIMIFIFIIALLSSLGYLQTIMSIILKGLEGREDPEVFYIVIPFFAVSFFVWIFLLIRLIKNKMAYLVYDISPDREQQIQAFYDDLFKLKDAEKVWMYKYENRHGDGRRNAGATSDVSRELTGMYHSEIKGLKTNVHVPVIGDYIHFFPDALFIYRGKNRGKKIKTIPYKDIEIQLSTTQFRETGAIPSDSEKIGTTWKYVNNDGSPDRRFNNNRKIPVLKYCGIKITDNNRFSLSLLVSNYETGKNFANAINAYKQKI